METSKRLRQLLPPMDCARETPASWQQVQDFREGEPPTDEGGKPTLDVPTIMYEPAANRSAAAWRLLSELHDALHREAS